MQKSRKPHFISRRIFDPRRFVHKATGDNALIAVDWGTSNFRAYRLDVNGEVFDKIIAPAGVIDTAEGNFAATLRKLTSRWLDLGEDRILLSGMVGSRQGWTETEYLPCPVGIRDLASAVVSLPFAGAEVLLIPGVIGRDEDDIPEVMRGEETEAMGVLDRCRGTGVICLPGTHSKWIHLQNGAIVNFSTHMTGDTYAALRRATILSKLMAADAPNDDAAFFRGVMRSADDGGLLHHLFGVRTLGLMGQLSEHASPSYLSGLLIGHEIRSAMRMPIHVHLVGAASLCHLYRVAIEACGGTASIEDEKASARGHAAIARRLGWLED